MASTKKVTLPDGSSLTFPSDLSVAEIRSALSSSGSANVDNAVVSTAPNGDITFSAPQGGRKG